MAQDAVAAYQKAIAKHRLAFGTQGPVQVGASKTHKTRNVSKELKPGGHNNKLLKT